MKTSVPPIVFLLLSISLLTGCDIFTISGKSPTKWENNIVYQTMQWDMNASEEDVRHDFCKSGQPVIPRRDGNWVF
ncbi:MAG: hypothetical protein PHQ77_03325 [Proteiniphilum sp.]|jgi:hypothetical protein|nr:hypothetical protein [Proteiniphilum sp.]